MIAAIAPISAGSIVLGISAVGLLFALHHLRIQPTRKKTATLLFWRQSVRPQRTRVPWAKRFSNWRTFVLLSAISLLAAAALTADRWAPIGRRADQDVIVLDTGAATADLDAAGRTRLDAEKSLAENDWNHFSGMPALISAGPTPELVSATGTPLSVIRRQLKLLTPEPGASAAALAFQLAAGLQGRHAGRIVWYTSESRVPEGVPAEVAGRVIVRHVTPGVTSEIVGASCIPDPINPTRVNVCVSVAGNSNTSSMVQAKWGVNTIDKFVKRVGDDSEVRFDEIAADAGQVLLRVDGGIVVPFRLPDRRPLSFRIVGSVPSALRAALHACGRIADDGEIAVAERGIPLPAAMKTAVLIEPSDQLADELLTLVDPVDRPLSLEQARVRRKPAGPMPGQSLMMAGGRAVASLSIAPADRTLYLADSLVADSAEFPRRAAFPLLIAAWCDRLVGRSVTAAVVPNLRAAEDPLWPGPEGHGYATTVADRPTLLQSATSTIPLPGPAGLHASWTTLVLCAALLLLVVEGVLFAARKIV